MNKELKQKLWEMIRYAQDSIRYESEDDEHWEITLSLALHAARELKAIINEEE